MGVEEQFYLLWPQLIQRIGRKYLLIVFGFIALAPFWSFPVRYLSEEVADGIDFFVELCPFYFMAAGALAAYALFFHESTLKKILRLKVLFLGNTLFFMFLMLMPQHKLFFAFVVALELLFIIQTDFRINLRSRILSKVGDISYGVYMYHPIVLFFVFGLVEMFLPVGSSAWLYNTLVYGVSLVLTLIISHVSYQYFEKWFLALKNKKYAVISTTEDKD